MTLLISLELLHMTDHHTVPPNTRCHSESLSPGSSTQNQHPGKLQSRVCQTYILAFALLGSHYTLHLSPSSYWEVSFPDLS